MILKLDPLAWYDEYALRIAGLRPAALKAAREGGKLRYKDVGSTLLYKGRWVIDWLDEGEGGGKEDGGH